MLKNNGFIFIIHFFVSNHKDIKKRNSFLFVLKIKSMIINSFLIVFAFLQIRSPLCTMNFKTGFRYPEMQRAYSVAEASLALFLLQ